MIKSLPLTRGRVLALAIGVPLMLAIVGWTGFNWVALAGQGSYAVRLSLPATRGTAAFSIDSGNMTVGQAAGSQRIQVTGTAHYSLIRSTLTLRRTASGAEMSSGCHLFTGVCSDDLSVTVPAGIRTLLSDGSGDVTLRGLTGYVSARNGSGNINASDLPRSADLEAGSGDIVGTALSGLRLTLKDGSGNITVSGLTSGDVLATDGSGDVNLTFTAVPSAVHISDGSGNVTLILPPGNTLYKVNASTSSGNRNVHLPNSTASQHLITVTDGSGDINISN